MASPERRYCRACGWRFAVPWTVGGREEPPQHHSLIGAGPCPRDRGVGLWPENLRPGDDCASVKRICDSATFAWPGRVVDGVTLPADLVVETCVVCKQWVCESDEGTALVDAALAAARR